MEIFLFISFVEKYGERILTFLFCMDAQQTIFIIKVSAKNYSRTNSKWTVWLNLHYGRTSDGDPFFPRIRIPKTFHS